MASFPVAGTLMVEPTESESLHELDRFCDAMIAIRGEIARVEAGEWPADDNPLRNAPHTAEDVAADEWTHPYRRETAVYPPASWRRRSTGPGLQVTDATSIALGRACTRRARPQRHSPWFRQFT